MVEAARQPWPVELRVKRAERMLEIDYDDGRSFRLPAELLRVESPSAEVQGHGGEKTVVAGKSGVGLREAEPVGNYAVRLVFDDGHDTGIYTWSYLRELGQNQERIFTAYLEALAARGLAR
jgi:DUF971 family protein